MRLNRRRAIVASSALSLLASAVLGVLCGLSYLSQQYICSRTHKEGDFSVQTLCHSTRGAITIRGTSWHHVDRNTGPPPRPTKLFGFEFTDARWRVRTLRAGASESLPYFYLRIPYWPFVVVTGLWGAIWCHAVVRNIEDKRRATRRASFHGFTVGKTVKAENGRRDETGTGPSNARSR